MRGVDFSSCVTRSVGKPRGSAAQRAGVYYERAVTAWFAARFLVAEQATLSTGCARPCFPDLLVFDRACTSCVVVEIKRQYVEAAQPQASRYAALLRRAYPWLRVTTLVVCGELTRLEARLRLVSPAEVFSLQEDALSVLVLSKRELRLGNLDGLDFCGGTSFGLVRELGGVRDRLGFHGGVPCVAAKAGA